MQTSRKALTFKTSRQKDHFKIFIIFAISENLSFKSQIKSTIFKSNMQN